MRNITLHVVSALVLSGLVVCGRASAEGTVREPKYYEGFADHKGDEGQHIRYFTYRTDTGVLVSGITMSVTFVLNRPVKDVWPYAKDWNLWMSDLHWSGVVGDLEGKPLRAPEEPYEFHVVRVIPEYMIALDQPVPKDGGNGGVSPGFQVMTLDERDGKTVVTFTMEQASGSKELTEEQALAALRKSQVQYRREFTEGYIPALKKLVGGGKQ